MQITPIYFACQRGGRYGIVAMQKGIFHMELKEWAQALRITAGHEETGEAILKLIDDRDWLDGNEEAMRVAMQGQDVDPGDDIVASMEQVLARYAFVRDTFNVREEFDLSDDDHMVKMLGVLAEGDRALSFKWKVLGVLRKAGAITEGPCKLDDASLLMILEMMMP